MEYFLFKLGSGRDPAPNKATSWKMFSDEAGAKALRSLELDCRVCADFETPFEEVMHERHNNAARSILLNISSV